MPRKNLAGTYSGESERLTIRLSLVDRTTLDRLAADWQTDRSETIRRAIREVAARVQRQRREQLRANLDTLTVAELKTLARRYGVPGRSTMSKSQLRNAMYSSL